MYVNNKIVCFLNNTIQEISWISLYRDSFLISYRYPKFSISRSTNYDCIIHYKVVNSVQCCTWKWLTLFNSYPAHSPNYSTNFMARSQDYTMPVLPYIES